MNFRRGDPQADSAAVSVHVAALAAELDALVVQWQGSGHDSHLQVVMKPTQRWVASLSRRSNVELICLVCGSVRLQTADTDSPVDTSEPGIGLMELTELDACGRAVCDHLEPGHKMRLRLESRL